MEEIRNTASKLYGLIGTKSIDYLGEHWDSESIRYIIQYDALKICSLIYLLSDEDERQVICEGLTKLFEYSKPRECVTQILEEIDINNFKRDLFQCVPTIIALSYAANPNEDSDAGLYLTILRTLVFATISSKSDMKADIRLTFIVAYFKCCEDKLKTKQIDCYDQINLNVENIERALDDYSVLNSYLKIPGLEDNKTDVIFRNIRRLVSDGTIEHILNKEIKGEIHADISKSRIENIVKFIDEIDYRSEYMDRMFEKFLSSIRFTLTSSSDEDSDDEVILNDDDKFERMVEKLSKNKDEVNELLGDQVELLLDDKLTGNREVICSADVFTCLREIFKRSNDGVGTECLLIKYLDRERAVYSIKVIINDLERIIEEHIREKKLSSPKYKFDDRCLPAQYTHFDNNEVNESNVKMLYNNLKKIEQKYKKGFFINNNDYYVSGNGTGISDWESECCYEQLKYIENIMWTGNAIACAPMYNTHMTIRKFNIKELEYYLYWRTLFFKGHVIECWYPVLYICMNEILAGIGTFNNHERVKLLNRLEKVDELNRESEQYGCYYFNRECERAIINYEKIFNMVNKSALFRGDVTAWRHEWDYCAKEIVDRDYTHLFEVMDKQSKYHPLTGALNKKVECSTYMVDCIKYCAPCLDDLLMNNGLSLSEVIVGHVKVFDVARIPEAYLWTDRVQDRLFGDQKSNAITSAYAYQTYLLPEYILKTVENAFRSYFNIGSKLKVVKPTEICNNHYYYITNNYYNKKYARQFTQDDKKKFLGIFTELDRNLEAHIDEYIKINANELFKLKMQHVTVKGDKSGPDSYVKKVATDELMIQFINSTNESYGQVESLIDIYKKASVKPANINSNIIIHMMWDFWILHKSDISYQQMNEVMVYGKRNVVEFRALQQRKFADALSYLYSIYDPCAKVKKKIDENEVADSVIITFYCLDRIYGAYGIDFVEMLLGRFEAHTWNIYASNEQVMNNVTTPIIKNIGDVEIYHFDPHKMTSVVYRYSCSQKSKDFITYILKTIENKFCCLLWNCEVVSHDCDKQYCEANGAIEDMDVIIDEITSIVTDFVLNYNNPKYKKTSIQDNIIVSSELKRNYIFNKTEKVYNMSSLAEQETKKYYKLQEQVDLNSFKPFKVLDIGLDGFDIKLWINRYNDRKRISQSQISLNLLRFKKMYPEIQNRLISVINNKVEYNPNFNFFFSKVMDSYSGLVNRDLVTLSALCEDGSDFMQWVEWIKMGKFVYTKNKPYVEVLFHLMINDVILSENRAACLLLMCEIWNYYYKDEKDMSEGADLYLEWIKEYWMLYCMDMVSYTEFKSLFIYEISFYNENGITNEQNHFSVNMDTFAEDNLLQFYNQNCDYKVLEGLIVQKGYRNLLEEALEKVHEALVELWAKYDLDFLSYLHIKEYTVSEKTRELFYRSILTDDTKRKILEGANEFYINAGEKYECVYDYDKELPILRYLIKSVNNASSRILMEYILKLTEKFVREWLYMPYSFKFNEHQLKELFPNLLFSDNEKSFLIERTIMETVINVCEKSGIETINPKIIKAYSAGDEIFQNLTEQTKLVEKKNDVQSYDKISEAVNTKQAEYDLIERNQKADKESIEKARRILKKNQERLIIDEEDILQDNTMSDDEATLFTDDERKLIVALLNGENIQNVITQFEGRFISINLLIESINDKSIDEIGDSIIEGYEMPHLVEEYIDDVRELLQK